MILQIESDRFRPGYWKTQFDLRQEQHVGGDFCKSWHWICPLFHVKFTNIPSLMQTYVAFDNIVRVCGDVSGQAKITDLCHSSLSQQDISGSQVSVDTLQNKDTTAFNILWFMTNPLYNVSDEWSALSKCSLVLNFHIWICNTKPLTLIHELAGHSILLPQLIHFSTACSNMRFRSVY